VARAITSAASLPPALLAAVLALSAWLAPFSPARAQVVRPAPSSPTAEAMPAAEAPVNDRLGKIGLNFGAGPVMLVNLKSEVRKVTESGVGLSGRFGYELPFGLVPELGIDFAHYLIKGGMSGVSANAVLVEGGARYIHRFGVVNPFAAVGGGYLLNSGDAGRNVLGSGAGFTVGGGLDVRVHTHVYLELNVRYLGYFHDGLTSALLLNAAITLFY
jgi:opacity protein-like surface antigen